MDAVPATDPNLALIRAAQLKTVRAAQTAELAKGMDTDKIDEAAQKFEAAFLTQMLKPMFEDIKPDPVFGGGKGEEIFQSMMLEQYGQMMAERGGIGIADQVRAEMIRMQAEANNKNTGTSTQINQQITTTATTTTNNTDQTAGEKP